MLLRVWLTASWLMAHQLRLPRNPSAANDPVRRRLGHGLSIAGPEPVNCARVFVNCSIEFKPATWLHQNKSKTFSCAT